MLLFLQQKNSKKIGCFMKKLIIITLLSISPLIFSSDNSSQLSFWKKFSIQVTQHNQIAETEKIYLNIAKKK